jgi:hypothetical protein
METRCSVPSPGVCRMKSSIRFGITSAVLVSLLAAQVQAQSPGELPIDRTGNDEWPYSIEPTHPQFYRLDDRPNWLFPVIGATIGGIYGVIAYARGHGDYQIGPVIGITAAVAIGTAAGALLDAVLR